MLGLKNVLKSGPTFHVITVPALNEAPSFFSSLWHSSALCHLEQCVNFDLMTLCLDAWFPSEPGGKYSVICMCIPPSLASVIIVCTFYSIFCELSIFIGTVSLAAPRDVQINYFYLFSAI